MKLTLTAPAKINLFLDVTGRRPNGYHTITGVMQAVSLCDTVTVEVIDPTGMYVCSLGTRTTGAESITLTCRNPDLPTDSRNLAWRAAEAFFAATGRGCKKLLIHIEKNIPAAAGMAGGSTDAAAVLVALNKLFGHPLTAEVLCGVGLTLGADVPFCIKGKAHITEGIGEVLTPITPMPECELVVACGGEGVSTPAAYKALDTLYGGFDPAAYTPHTRELTALKTALWQGNLTDLCGSVFNLFESVVLPERPVARQIKETLLAAGAVTALMSGSGPSVFGVFPKGDGAAQSAAERAREALTALGIPAWVCEPVRD
ncbi:MAG: 4-(cytidine 5'-diphospho)-2-C-methyl-D-erythritol kinase [Clostridia bacterium]|nr:4-(cytidine 5'-diphospho)-2-C-methyl-D-erythritol kinase [Clostridia bacterium]